VTTFPRKRGGDPKQYAYDDTTGNFSPQTRG